MSIKNPVVAKVFNDLDAYRDYCRFEGKVFNEKALYNKKDANWQAYEKYRGWLRAKASNKYRAARRK
jgi:CRISPR/Cas system CSM-associated protein Csm5 (group 7 of RAMP superfamily)|tara:strand:+ start:755 stop:955 length:201 start_codon:yes stop_codon:yes gene_type:complete